MKHPGPLRVGLTGGIASGKSLVADSFARLGIQVIDADEISHALLAPGAPLLASIREEFGSEIFDPNGELNRSRLRRLVFDSESCRRRLEAILHPAILKELNAAAESAEGPYLIMVIPLLVEVGAADMVGRVLVVDCTVDTQIERLIGRDGIDLALARSMVAAQATREERIALADDIIDNNGSPEETDRMVATLDSFYRQLAA
ncbi:MAG: dephospho-CoA kinase [Gammaproteobacteria bacterium]|nr:dephospho-CoA kinase [Gammaproteobacteria bacterium]